MKNVKIESFTAQNQTFVNVTANDGASGIGQVANYHNGITVKVLHIMVVIENAAPFLAYSIERTLWAEQLYSSFLIIIDGEVIFPEGPGWGITVNDSWLNKAKYQKIEV